MNKVIDNFPERFECLKKYFSLFESKDEVLMCKEELLKSTNLKDLVLMKIFITHHFDSLFNEKTEIEFKTIGNINYLKHPFSEKEISFSNEKITLTDSRDNVNFPFSAIIDTVIPKVSPFDVYFLDFSYCKLVDDDMDTLSLFLEKINNPHCHVIVDLSMNDLALISKIEPLLTRFNNVWINVSDNRIRAEELKHYVHNNFNNISKKLVLFSEQYLSDNRWSRDQHYLKFISTYYFIRKNIQRAVYFGKNDFIINENAFLNFK